MSYGLYTIFLGMRTRQNTLETQANNIANASTAGFKAQRLIYSTFEAQNKADGDKQRLIAGASAQSTTDFSAGSIRETSGTFDLAIKGDAFLVVETPRGPRYTRAGSLTVNENGQLTTKSGDLVAGEKGPITIPRDTQVSISKRGEISADGTAIDSLKLVRFQNPAVALIRDGETAFAASGAEVPQASPDSTVIQGAVEMSNVNSVGEMVAMINNNREFESLQKSLILTMNDVGRKIAGEIGRV